MKVNAFPVAAGVMVFGLLVVSVSANGEELAPGLHPSVSVGVLYDDNILRSSSNKKSGGALSLGSSIIYKFLFSKHSFDAGYYGQYTKYINYSNESYLAHNVDGRLKLDLSPRMKLNLIGGYVKSPDARGGSVTNTNVSQEPDLWNQTSFSGEFIYGRRESTAQVGFFLGTEGINYTNNNQNARDRTTGTFKSTFYYNVTSKSAWLLELDRRGISYSADSSINRDSVEMRYLMGAEWSATAQTEGDLRFGLLTKSIEGQDEVDFRGLTVDGKLSWSPLVRDRIAVGVSRTTKESPEVDADYFVTNDLSITWGHDLTALVDFNMSSFVQRNNQAGLIARKDTIVGFDVGLSVDLLKWLDFEVTYGYSARDSNLDELDYNGNIFKLAFAASL